MRARGAFLKQFQKEAIFAENFNELDDSAETVRALVEEYQVATTPEYLDWSGSEAKVCFP